MSWNQRRLTRCWLSGRRVDWLAGWIADGSDCSGCDGRFVSWRVSGPEGWGVDRQMGGTGTGG